jgi:hypothetical protein
VYRSLVMCLVIADFALLQRFAAFSSMPAGTGKFRRLAVLESADFRDRDRSIATPRAFGKSAMNFVLVS